MEILDIVNRLPPEPWAEGDNIPWNEPEFSRAMLKEHLSQAHDAASRRATTIDQHVRFVHEIVLARQSARILDLGCGPGLYLERLSRLGHTCQGIDFSPASIEYARQVATRDGLACTYHLGDLRSVDFGAGYDLVMFLYGEFNVFRPADIRTILQKAHAALKPGGKLLLEPSPEEHIRALGVEPAGWYTSPEGLFSPHPHLMLTESGWDATHQVATHRFYVIHAETGQVSRYAASYQAYNDAEYLALLAENGFVDIQFYPSLIGAGERAMDFFVILAYRHS